MTPMISLGARPSLPLLLLGLVCACHRPAVSATETETGSGAESGSDSETGAASPDLPPEPDCPAALGELVECDCGFTGPCELGSADGTACTVNCEPPSPCEAVVCEFDIAHGEPACVALVDPEALDCAFDTLLGGAATQVSLVLDNTYPFWGWTDRHTLTRLDGERFVFVHEKHVVYDAGPSPDPEWAARAALVSVEQLEGCASEDFAEARFACLFELWSTAEACADPSGWQCAP